MGNELNNLRIFGKFRLDSEKRVLWHDDEPVNLQPKEIDLLCVLTESGGEVVSKEELMDRVWENAFVEESNLSRRIYKMRKVFKELGAPDDLIQNIPRRGYRFTGEIAKPDELVIERHSISRTLIEEIHNSAPESLSLPEPNQSRVRKPLLLVGLIAAPLILMIALGSYFYPRFGSDTPQFSSIAVLPIKSFDTTTDNEELRLRITDALITKLGSLRDVTVRPTNSVLRFANGDVDALEAGKLLGVDAVLDGRIQFEGENIRLTFQLISTGSGEQLWSQQFDGKTGRILDLQDSVAFALAPKLRADSDALLAKNPTNDSQAYEKYLQARFFWNQRTPESYEKAIRFFEEAIAIDPNFALAYSGLADCYLLLNRRNDSSPEETFSAAEAAAQKSVFIDPDLAEGHASLGLLRTVYRRDWDKAEQHLRRAIELNPNYSVSYGWLGLTLLMNKRFAEAEMELKKAEKLDPTSRNIAVYLTLNYYNRREFDKAIEQSKKALDLDPKLTAALMYQSNSFEQKGSYEEAVASEIERQKIIDPNTIMGLKNAFSSGGIDGFWEKQIELRIKQPGKYTSCGFEKATRYALLRQFENSLKIIEENYEFGGTCWNSLGVEPAFDQLRSNSRFIDVLRKMKLEN